MRPPRQLWRQTIAEMNLTSHATRPAIAGESKQLVVGDGDKLYLFDVNAGRQTTIPLRNRVYVTAISEDSSHVVAWTRGNNRQAIEIYDQRGKLQVEIDTPEGSVESWSRLRVSADGRIIAAQNSNFACVCDDHGQMLSHWKTQPLPFGSVGVPESFEDLVLSPDGGFVVLKHSLSRGRPTQAYVFSVPGMRQLDVETEFVVELILGRICAANRVLAAINKRAITTIQIEGDVAGLSERHELVRDGEKIEGRAVAIAQDGRRLLYMTKRKGERILNLFDLVTKSASRDLIVFSKGSRLGPGQVVTSRDLSLLFMAENVRKGWFSKEQYYLLYELALE